MQMCILAGCDFLKALSKIGIKKAHAHIRKFKTFVRVRLSSSRNDRLFARLAIASANVYHCWYQLLCWLHVCHRWSAKDASEEHCI